MSVASPFDQPKVIKAHCKIPTAGVRDQDRQYDPHYQNGAGRAPRILIIGCGGTGGWVIPQVARLIKTLGVGSLTIADGDRVEHKNLGRQNFVESDLGEWKAVSLAKRYSGAFGIQIRAIPGFLEELVGITRNAPHILVGCVDKHSARRLMAEYLSQSYGTVWVDSGNEKVAGQVVCGYSGPQYRTTMRGTGPMDVALPTISQLHELPVGGQVRPSCAEMMETTTQVSTVNALAAVYVTNFVRMILEDCKAAQLRAPVKGLAFHAVYFNVEGGSTTLWNYPKNLEKAKAPMCPWNLSERRR